LLSHTHTHVPRYALYCTCTLIAHSAAHLAHKLFHACATAADDAKRWKDVGLVVKVPGVSSYSIKKLGVTDTDKLRKVCRRRIHYADKLRRVDEEVSMMLIDTRGVRGVKLRLTLHGEEEGVIAIRGRQ